LAEAATQLYLLTIAIEAMHAAARRPTICSDEVDAGGFRTGPPSKTRHAPRRWKGSLFCCYPPRLEPRRNFADSAPRKKWRLLAGSSSGMPSHPSSTLWEMGPQTGPGASLEIARFCFLFLFPGFVKDILRRRQTIGGFRL
jgi:hypothetical protein